MPRRNIFAEDIRATSRVASKPERRGASLVHNSSPIIEEKCSILLVYIAYFSSFIKFEDVHID